MSTQFVTRITIKLQRKYSKASHKNLTNKNSV